MITKIFEEKNKTLMLISKASVVLYLCLFFALTLFTDSAYASEVTMLSLWGIFCCYFFGFQSIKKDDGKIIKSILFFSAIFYIIMFFVVPPTSSDFYHYYFEDYVWTQEKLNPYFFSPNDLFLNPSAQFTHWPDLAAQHGP